MSHFAPGYLPPRLTAESLDVEQLSDRELAMYLVGRCAMARICGVGVYEGNPDQVADDQAAKVLAGTATPGEAQHVRKYVIEHIGRTRDFSRIKRNGYLRAAGLPTEPETDVTETRL